MYVVKCVVYSSDLKPKASANGEECGVRPVHSRILLAKLRAGQELKLEATCSKGIGAQHAKWSPVSTASYRLLPKIEFTRPITGDEAEALKVVCPMNVFDIEDGVAVANRPLNCTVCRECTRGHSFSSDLRLLREKDVFICTYYVNGARWARCTVHSTIGSVCTVHHEC